MQRAQLFLPPEDAFPNLEVKMLHEPASDEALVGGDFWDIFAYDNSHVALVIGDVMGHGLDAAVFTTEIRFILRAFLREHEQPSLVLKQLNSYVCENHRLFREGLNPEGTTPRSVSRWPSLIPSLAKAASCARGWKHRSSLGPTER